MIFLSDAENHTIVSSFIWKIHQNVTEGHTDRWNRSGYYSGLHCEQCGCAVESNSIGASMALKDK